jgi:hypothetical protein
LGSNPINLAVRFLLEMSALVALGFWGWSLADGWWSVLPGLGIPLLAAAAWGTFAVLNDPSRSGRAPIPVPGWARLALEVAFFGFAVWALFDLESEVLGWILGVAVIGHYAISYDRIVWLLARRS